MSESPKQRRDRLRESAMNRLFICLASWGIVVLDLSSGLFYWSSGRNPSVSELIGHGIAILGGVVVGSVTAVSAMVYGILWWQASRRARTGCCPTCNYDLRATPDRCPECGTDIAKN